MNYITFYDISRIKKSDETVVTCWILGNQTIFHRSNSQPNSISVLLIQDGDQTKPNMMFTMHRNGTSLMAIIIMLIPSVQSFQIHPSTFIAPSSSSVLTQFHAHNGFTKYVSLSSSSSSSSSSLKMSSNDINNGNASPISHDIIKDKHVLVVGGSGRVGGSVVTQILKYGGSVTVGATSQESFEVSQNRWKE